MEQRPRMLTKKAYKELNPCYLKLLTKLILSVLTQLASLFLDLFFLRNHMSRRELPDSIQIKFLHFTENNAIRKQVQQCFILFYIFLSFLLIQENILSFGSNGAQRKYALGITRLKLVIFKEHIFKLDLL